MLSAAQQYVEITQEPCAPLGSSTCARYHVKQAALTLAQSSGLTSHYAAVSDEEIAEIERLANIETLENSPVRAFETTKDEAESLGAIAFLATSTATSCESKLESRPNFAEALTSSDRRHRHHQNCRRVIHRVELAPY